MTAVTRLLRRLGLALVLLGAVAAGGCQAPARPRAALQVTLVADGETRRLEVPAGTTVRQALEQAGVELGPLDRVTPPEYTLLTDGDTITVVRVREEFETQEEVIPFERQTLRNEGLPEGETRLVQRGVNGRQEVTYRLVYEDGQLVARQPVKVTVLEEPVPEIVMVGARALFVPRPLAGRLAYLAGGNAWLMETATDQRRPVVVTGDLDGRVFRLSYDGSRLLFTRRSEQEGVINTLWMAVLDADPVELIDLGIANVVHFADFSPRNPRYVVASTVEPRDAPPGWQANNDLVAVIVTPGGTVLEPKVLLEPNAGGVYGWWGNDFAWRPDVQGLAVARPDGVAYLDLTPDEPTLEMWLPFTPYQTRSDWAWVPGVAWSPDGQVLFAVTHGPPGETNGDEAAPQFHLVAYLTAWEQAVILAPDVGMFAYPAPSPWQEAPDGTPTYRVAYLQAITPHQSELSRYRLMVMDRDGSDARALFPGDEGIGLEPQRVHWSPQPMPDSGHWALAVLYEGDLYLVDAVTGEAQPLTGDGQVVAVDWK
ncbi:MAG: DUF348 domain-containing protein [Chloroflexi bacterium]|nr:DUF348 domain-containing protein [Chloroflexota bacterium]